MDTETQALWTTTREAMGKTWSVQLCANEQLLDKDGSNLGRTQLIYHDIRINASMPQDERGETLLHELLHCANEQTRLQLKEDVISRLSPILYAFLRGFGLWHEFPWPDREESDAGT